MAIELLRRFPEQFTNDFEQCKLKVGELTDVKYVGMRNRIAGYVVRYRRAHPAT